MVLAFEEMVAATDADESEASLPQESQQLRAAWPRQLSHELAPRDSNPFAESLMAN